MSKLQEPTLWIAYVLDALRAVILWFIDYGDTSWFSICSDGNGAKTGAISAGRVLSRGFNHCFACSANLAIDIPPRIPKTRERERLFVLQVKPERNFPIPFSTPLIKAICGNKTTLALDEPPIARFFGDCLGARIDHHVIGRSMNPAPNTEPSPTSSALFVDAVVLNYDRHFL